MSMNKSCSHGRCFFMASNISCSFIYQTSCPFICGSFFMPITCIFHAHLWFSHFNAHEFFMPGIWANDIFMPMNFFQSFLWPLMIIAISSCFFMPIIPLIIHAHYLSFMGISLKSCSFTRAASPRSDKHQTEEP